MPKYNASMPSATFDYADKDAIMRSSIPQGLVGEQLRFDSAEDASVFFARELDYVKAQSYDKEYPELTALKLFPVSHEVPEGAETVTYYGYEKTGFAKIISNYATDLPRADVKGTPTTAQIKSIGASYGYSMQDMRASRLAGKSLDTRRGEAAKYQIDRLMNKIAWAGDEEAGLVGILSAGNNIPVYTLLNEGSQFQYRALLECDVSFTTTSYGRYGMDGIDPEDLPSDSKGGGRDMQTGPYVIDDAEIEGGVE